MAELKKSLGYPTIIAVTVTAMMGTGMFFGAALGAKYSGPASIIAWGILAAITIYISMCFAELISMFPKAGGVYEFAKQSYGRFPAFMVGWTTWIVSNLTTAVMIVAALNYFLPGYTDSIKLAIGILIIISLNSIAYVGIEASGAMLMGFATVSLVVLVTILTLGTRLVDPVNYHPFFTTSWPFIFVSLFFIMETFFGWEQASFLAEETKNAEHVIPRGLIISTIITCFIGVATAIVVIGIVPWQTLANSETPLSTIFSMLFSDTWGMIANIGIVLTLIGGAAGAIIASPRLLLAMSRDKLFIDKLEEVHPKFQTPGKAIIFQTCITILVLIAAFGKYTILLSLLVPMALFMYAAVLLSLVVLRFKKPEHPRPFKVPLGVVGPIVIILVYLGSIIPWLIFEPKAPWLFALMLSFVFFGFPIYLLLTFYYNPDAIVKATGAFSKMSYSLESVILPKRIRKKVLSLFEEFENKVILDFGCGVGTLTLVLAELVGKRGVVYATDVSESNIKLLLNRLNRRGHKHVRVLHDPHQMNRVHPHVGNVDYVFSVGMIGYIQDIQKVLRHMNQILPEFGKICFVEYVDFFKFIPNPAWLDSTKKIQKEFEQAGFQVQVVKEKGLFWNYLVIYGHKSKSKVPFI